MAKATDNIIVRKSDNRVDVYPSGVNFTGTICIQRDTYAAQYGEERWIAIRNGGPNSGRRIAPAMFRERDIFSKDGVTFLIVEMVREGLID